MPNFVELCAKRLQTWKRLGPRKDGFHVERSRDLPISLPVCKIFLDVIVVVNNVYTTDMILSEVHLCIMSAVLMRTVFGIGPASIHTPSLRCTCSTIQLYTVPLAGLQASRPKLIDGLIYL